MTHASVLHDIPEERARELLASHTVGRLVERVGDIVDIFPINYWSDGHSVVFRTAAGPKLAGIATANEVLRETDHVTEEFSWSVVARGTARILEDNDEIEDATQLELNPMVPTKKPVFVEITAEEVTGREFVPGNDGGPEVEPETVA